jgi:hypothetical protein
MTNINFETDFDGFVAYVRARSMWGMRSLGEPGCPRHAGAR